MGQGFQGVTFKKKRLQISEVTQIVKLLPNFIKNSIIFRFTIRMKFY